MAARAFYVQQHWDQDVARLQKTYLDRYVSKRNQEIAAWCGILTRAVQDQYISYTWHFP